jgi:hypothetical protein
MSNTLKQKAVPFGETGAISPNSTISWVFGQWKKILSQIPSEIYLQGISFQTTTNPGVDSDREMLIEIGLGNINNAITKIQLPFSIRADTAVAFFLSPNNIILPEPFVIPAQSDVCIRVASNSGMGINGIKLLYQSDTQLNPYREMSMNNFEFVTVGNGMSVTEKIR